MIIIKLKVQTGKEQKKTIRTKLRGGQRPLTFKWDGQTSRKKETQI